jgi:hypothetical protein
MIFNLHAERQVGFCLALTKAKARGTPYAISSKDSQADIQGSSVDIHLLSNESARMLCDRRCAGQLLFPL